MAIHPAVAAAPEPFRADAAVVRALEARLRQRVKGEVQLLYRTHCPCGHQWESAELQRLTICSTCGRAVLVELPTLTP